MNPPPVGVIMGSRSDWETMKEACDVLDELAVAALYNVIICQSDSDTS